MVHEPKSGALSVLDELAELYWATGDERYLELGSAAVAHHPPLRTMRAQGRALPMHAYSMLTYLGGATKIMHARGDREELRWIEAVWADIAENHLFPTASLTTGEFIPRDR
jgi:hypothetical protein